MIRIQVHCIQWRLLVFWRMNMGLNAFVLPTLKSNKQLLADFEKQLSLHVDLVQDRCEAKRHPIFVIFRPSGRPRDEFEDVVQKFINGKLWSDHDDIILVTVLKNTRIHSFFLEEMRQKFKFVEALSLSNGSIDGPANRNTFENLKQILTGDFSFRCAKEICERVTGSHNTGDVDTVTPKTASYEFTHTSTKLSISPTSPEQSSIPTSCADGRERDHCTPSQLDTNQVGTSVCTKSQFKHPTKEETYLQTGEDDQNNQQELFPTTQEICERMNGSHHTGDVDTVPPKTASEFTHTSTKSSVSPKSPEQSSIPTSYADGRERDHCTSSQLDTNQVGTSVCTKSQFKHPTKEKTYLQTGEDDQNNQQELFPTTQGGTVQKRRQPNTESMYGHPSEITKDELRKKQPSPNLQEESRCTSSETAEIYQVNRTETSSAESEHLQDLRPAFFSIQDSDKGISNTYEIQTIHNMLESMNSDKTSLQASIEDTLFPSKPGCLLDILNAMKKELEAAKDKVSGRPGQLELSSETLWKLESELDMTHGKLMEVLHALYFPETVMHVSTADNTHPVHDVLHSSWRTMRSCGRWLLKHVSHRRGSSERDAKSLIQEELDGEIKYSKGAPSTS